MGACSIAAAAAAHSLAGGGLPGGSSVVLLVLATMVIGALASTPAPHRHALTIVAAQLAAGQALGHCTLVVAGGHSHGDHWSSSMLVAHLLAALGCAALICAAERLFCRLAGRIWRLVVVTLALRGDDVRRGVAPVWPAPRLVTRVLLGCGPGTRGPPVLTAG